MIFFPANTVNLANVAEYLKKKGKKFGISFNAWLVRILGKNFALFKLESYVCPSYFLQFLLKSFLKFNFNLWSSDYSRQQVLSSTFYSVLFL
jgi:hypothetical protein